MEAGFHSEGEEEAGGSIKGASGAESEDDREPMLRDLTGMIQALMGQQEPRELKQREEATRQEQQFQALQQQFRLLQHEVQVHASAERSMMSHPLKSPETGNDDQQTRVAVSTEPSHSGNNAVQFHFGHEPRLGKTD